MARPQMMSRPPRMMRSATQTSAQRRAHGYKHVPAGRGAGLRGQDQACRIPRGPHRGGAGGHRGCGLRAGPLPALRVGPSREEGPWRGWLPEMDVQGLRQDLLRQDDGAPRVFEAGPRGMGQVRALRAVRLQPARGCQGVRCVPEDRMVHAHQALRGHAALPAGVPPWPWHRHGGGRHLPHRIAQGEPREAARSA